MGPSGETELLKATEERPGYRQLEALLLATPGSNSSKGWAERLREEIAFNNRSLK